MRYRVNHEWSDPIHIAAGDIIENRGKGRILISTVLEAPSINNALTLRPGESRTMRNAVTVVGRTVLRAANDLFVISGFGRT